MKSCRGGERKGVTVWRGGHGGGGRVGWGGQVGGLKVSNKNLFVY